MSDVRAVIAELRARAEKEALGVDLSDWGDEAVQGYLLGQANALDELVWQLDEIEEKERDEPS